MLDLINIQKKCQLVSKRFEDLDFVKRFNINGTPFLLASKTIDDRHHFWSIFKLTESLLIFQNGLKRTLKLSKTTKDHRLGYIHQRPRT